MFKMDRVNVELLSLPLLVIAPILWVIRKIREGMLRNAK